jgi:hypothetical protein
MNQHETTRCHYLNSRPTVISKVNTPCNIVQVLDYFTQVFLKMIFNSLIAGYAILTVVFSQSKLLVRILLLH